MTFFAPKTAAFSPSRANIAEANHSFTPLDPHLPLHQTHSNTNSQPSLLFRSRFFTAQQSKVSPFYLATPLKLDCLSSSLHDSHCGILPTLDHSHTRPAALLLSRYRCPIKNTVSASRAQPNLNSNLSIALIPLHKSPKPHFIPILRKTSLHKP